MMSLIDLPPDVLGGVVFACLDTKSIVRLDCAVCQATRRKGFLEFLKSEHAILGDLPPASSSLTTRGSALQWAILRQVRCRKLTVNVGDSIELLQKHLRVTKQPAKVQLNKLKDTAYVCMMIAAHCRSMSSLFCAHCVLGCSVSSIYACCSSMQEVFLYECSLTAEHFAGISCPQVRTLALFRCKCDHQCLIAAVAMCPNIVNLDIGDNNVSDEAVRDVVTRVPQLQKLSLYALPVSDATIVDIATTCCSISAIDLGDCAALTDVAVIALATHCTQLAHIQLYANNNYTRESLCAIAMHCTGLKRCVFDRFQGASDQDEVLLFQSCRHLESAEIRLSSPASVACIPPSVTQHTLQAATTTDAMLFAVAKHCRNLTKLSITHGNPANRVHTAKGLAAIAKGCTELRKLVLHGDTEQVPELALLLWRNTCSQLQVVGALERWEYFILSPAE